MYSRVIIACLLAFGTLPALADRSIDNALVASGSNRSELERALADAPEAQRAHMAWLIAHMPTTDLTGLDAKFLLKHVDAATMAWEHAPWHAQVDEALFREAILPYANVSEQRELWIEPLRAQCMPMIEGLASPDVCAVALNQKLFPATKVQYSTKRKRADQSPSESIASGMASCTGLSILLIDACRSVGIPARFVGVPMWMDGSGNHSWVEVWDGTQWRFTGAAEPAGDKLDEGWFSARAAAQDNANPEHAIYAVTWRDTGIAFPMRFDEHGPEVHAVDVTDRYKRSATTVMEGQELVRVVVRDRGSKQRVARTVVCCDRAGAELARGTSRDEKCDLNDHLELLVPQSASISFAVAEEPLSKQVRENSDDLTLTLFVEGAPSKGLSKEESDRLTKTLVQTYINEARVKEEAEFRARVLKLDALEMPFWFATYGEKPAAGRSLFISMHGGGGAPKEVNDQQWENQKKLYQPKEGVYVAPRAPTNTWNLWHEGHIDPLFDRLIRDMILFEGVDPNKVYIMGYSAGGDGVFQLTPRMADRFAAAAMMAGHPNETKPDGLRNLPFTLHMGGNDAAFKRNEIGRQWGTMLDACAAADAGGYPHEVVIHEGKGHWMDRKDAVAIGWMAKYTRDLRPKKIVWLQDDVTEARFYWLANAQPKAGQRVVAMRDAQIITIEEASGVEELRIRLDDSMLDLDLPVRVEMHGSALFEGIVPRTQETMMQTLNERGDPTGVFTAEIVVRVAPASP